MVKLEPHTANGGRSSPRAAIHAMQNPCLHVLINRNTHTNDARGSPASPARPIIIIIKMKSHKAGVGTFHAVEAYTAAIRSRIVEKIGKIVGRFGGVVSSGCHASRHR